MLEQETEDAGRDRADDEQPAEFRVVGRSRRCRGRGGSGRSLAGCAPSRAGRRGRGRSPLPGASPPGSSGSTGRSGGYPSRAASAGSRCDRGWRSGRARRSPAAGRARPLGRTRSARRRSRRLFLAGLEPREHEQDQPDEERGDAVLDVMVCRSGFVPGEPRRERVRRLGPVDDGEGDRATRRARRFRRRGESGCSQGCLSIVDEADPPRREVWRSAPTALPVRSVNKCG